MKTKNNLVAQLIRFVPVAAVAILFLVFPTQGIGQTYQFSVPISGYFDLNVDDYDSFSSGNSVSGYGSANFGTLNETVTYNPANQTLEQSGNITLVSSTNTATINESRVINGQTVTGTVVVQQITTGGEFSFDSGVVNINNNGYYDFDLNSSLQINGNYTLSTGGQIYTGIFDPTISIGFPSLTSFPYDKISVAGNSATLSAEYSDTERGNFQSSGTVPFTASNGLNINLYSGSDGDDVHGFSFTFPSSAVATAVPEPPIAELAGLGGFLLLGAGIIKRVLSRWAI